MLSGHRISVNQLVKSLGMKSRVLGDPERCCLSVSRIDDTDKESVTFCNKNGEAGLQMVRDSRAAIVICPDDLDLDPGDYKAKTIILVPDPRLAMLRVMQRYFVQKPAPGISPSSVIDENARIHPTACIGPNSYIGRCEIGEHSIVHGNVFIYDDTRIGRDVVIQAGAVIGAEGQGFERNEKGELEKFPQLGGVIIEDDVEVGSNASVMRGAFGATIIGRGTKIGHLCNIGHGAVIGKHCMIISKSMIGGSAQIGDGTQISFGACVRNKIRIGKNVMVGMGSVVTENIGDGKIVFGVPAKEKR